MGCSFYLNSFLKQYFSLPDLNNFHIKKEYILFRWLSWRFFGTVKQNKKDSSKNGLITTGYL